MGAGASVPDEITFEQAKSLAGEKWDEKLTALWCVLASETPPPARKATVRSRFTDAGGLPPPCPFLAARTQTIAIFYRHEAQTQASFVSPNLLLGSRPLLGISLSLTLPLPLPKSFRRPEGKEKIPKEELFSIIQNVPMFAKRATTEEQLNVSRHCISNNPACTHSVTHYPPAFTHTHVHAYQSVQRSTQLTFTPTLTYSGTRKS